MPISSAAIGLASPRRGDLVDDQLCMTYAAALGAPAAYFDDSRPGGLPVAPTIAHVLEWPVSRDLRRQPRFGTSEAEQAKAIHVEQDTEFHRTLRPGDYLVAQSTLVGLERRLAGTLTTMRIDLTDGASRAVTTSYVRHLFRGVALDGPDGSIAGAPSWPDLPQPQAWQELRLPTHRGLAHLYTACTRIESPIHTDRGAALKAGLPDIILHGSCTLALAVQAMLAEQFVPMRLLRLGCSFTGFVVPGTAIIVRHGRVDEDTFVFEVLCDDGRRVIASGRVIAVACYPPV